MKFKDLFHKTAGKWYPDWEAIMRIDEFRKLALCKQSLKWHKEGDAWCHTVAVTNEMVNHLYKDYCPDMEKYYLMMISAALCHDLGKPSTTKWDEELQEYKTKCHGQVGAQITRSLFFDEDIIMREMVCYMVRHHMTLHHILDDPSKMERTLKKMSYGWVSVSDMLLLSMCDSFGSKNDVETRETTKERIQKIADTASKLNCLNTHYPFDKPYGKFTYFNNLPEDAALNEECDKFTVYILIGLPGAGKDTLINDVFPELPTVCRDEIRKSIGLKGEKPQGNKAQEDKVTHLFKKRFTELCQEGKDFVVNNTNLRKKYRAEYVNEAIKYGARIAFIYIEADSIDTNKKRREGMIAPSVIDGMFERMEFPEPYEFNNIYIIGKNEGKMTQEKFKAQFVIY